MFKKSFLCICLMHPVLAYAEKSVEPNPNRGQSDNAALVSSIEKSGALDMSEINARVEKYRNELIIQSYFSQLVSREVTESSLKAYYTEHKNEFEYERIKVAHILIKKGKKYRSGQEAHTLAGQILQKLEDGEDFSVLAKKYSDDYISAAKGGDMGWIKEGYLNEVFSKKVFSMSKEEVSPVFVSAAGLHIVKIIESQESHTLPFADVRHKIKSHLEVELKKSKMAKLNSI